MSGLKALFVLPVAAALAAAQTPCDQLKLSFPDVTVTSIQFVAAGPFAAPAPVIPAVGVAPAPAAPGRGAGRGPAQPAAAVPAYCRVQMILKPSPDSLIEAAMFLPAENWNGKLQVVGNGGWAGTVCNSAGVKQAGPSAPLHSNAAGS